MKTKKELATTMLRRSRIVGTLVEPAAEDLQRVTDIYDSKLAEWRDRNLVYWDNTGLDSAEIPDACFDTLVDLMVNADESQFGKNVQLSTLDRRSIEDRLLRWLRRHTRTRSSGMPIQPEYF